MLFEEAAASLVLPSSYPGAGTSPGLTGLTNQAPALAHDYLYDFSRLCHRGRGLNPATGSPLWTWEAHEPFGDTPPQAVNGFTFDARFPGQWHDDVTGLAFNGYRDYDPRTGRYLEPDPTGLASGPNPYAYVDNDPLERTDPEGLAWQLNTGFGVEGGFLFGFTGGNIVVSVNSNLSLTFSAEGHLESGLGLWLGAGGFAGLTHTDCNPPEGWSKSNEVAWDANFGAGDSVGASGIVDSHNVGMSIPLPHYGIGAGMMVGVGLGRNISYTTPAPPIVNKLKSFLDGWLP